MFRSRFTLTSGLVLVMAFSPGFLFAAVSVDGDIVPPTDPTTWNSDTGVQVGATGDGTLDVNGGSELSIKYCRLGWGAGASGVVTVAGTDSTLTTAERIMVGYNGNGTLNVTGGSMVDCPECYMGYFSSANVITVEGANSKFFCEGSLRIGVTGAGTLNIRDHGLVQVVGDLNLGFYNNSINMTSGGMLALVGKADDSLSEFFSLMVGTDTIQWWDDSIEAGGSWAPLTEARYGYDYKLDYFTEGDLAGYTRLTVGEGYFQGDANRDGRVDAGDATILAGNWQASTDSLASEAWSMGDFNQDGKVDAADATILAGNWQAGTNKTTVPEPSTIVLLFFAMGLGFVLRKRG